jgi:hypothetical protein
MITDPPPWPGEREFRTDLLTVSNTRPCMWEILLTHDRKIIGVKNFKRLCVNLSCGRPDRVVHAQADKPEKTRIPGGSA